MTTTLNWFGDALADFATWLYELLLGFVRQLANGERMLLCANLCLAAVGAYSSYLFYAPSRGPIVGALAAAGIEMLYLGGAGAAVKYRYQVVIAWLLVLIGTLASAFFGVMVGLHEALPQLFEADQPLPDARLWWTLGAPVVVEGVLPPLCALLLSILLHSMVSSRLKDQDVAQQRARADLAPFVCPFCDVAHKTANGLHGHTARCAALKADGRDSEAKKAMLWAAIEAGKRALGG